MAMLRVMGRWGVTVATAVAVPLFGHAISADSGSKKSTKMTSRMVRPSDLPIYEEPEEVLDFEYHGRERTSLEEGVGVVRQEIEGVFEATKSTREKVIHICETGKAHTMATVDYITDEDNMLSRAGAITIGGLAGLVLGARKKGGIAKKAFYTSTGVAATASLCYPRQAYQVSQDAYGAAKDYATIGYNFIAGVKPQSKVGSPDESKKEPPAQPSSEAETAPKTESSPAPAEATTTPESEGEEVRSVLSQAVPEEMSPAPVDKLAQQTSDVMQWGFRLTDKINNAASSVPPADVVPQTEPTIPEGFGSVSDADNKDVVESASEQVIVKEEEEEKKFNAAEIPAESLDTVPEIVDTIVEGIAVEVGEDLVEDTAKIVHEATEEVLEKVEKVADIADKVEEFTEKVSAAIDVVQDVLEAADKAAEETGASDTLIDITAMVVEGVERVVDTVNIVAEKVEDVAESIAEEVKELKTETAELIGSEEKREELVEKVLDYAKGMGISEFEGVAVEGELKEPESKVPEEVAELVTGIAEPAHEVPEPVIEPVFEVTDVIETVAESVPEVTETVAKPTPEVTEAVAEPAPEITEVAAEPAPEVTEAVAEPAPEVTEAVAKPAPEITEAVAEPAPEVTEAGAEPAPEITEAVAEPAPEVTEAVTEPAPEVAEAVAEPSPEVTEAVAEPPPEVTEAVAEPPPEVTEAVAELPPEVTEAVAEPSPEVTEAVAEPPPEVTEAVAEPVPEVTEIVAEPVEQVTEIVAEPAAQVPEPVAQSELKTEPESQVLVRKQGIFDRLKSLFSKDEDDKGTEESLHNAEKIAAPEDLIADAPVTVKEELKTESEIGSGVEEAIAEDIAKEVGEVVLEKAAKIAEDVSKEVKRDAEVVVETAEVVEDVSEKAESVIKVVEEVAEAAQEVSVMPEIVEEVAVRVEEVSEKAEAIVDTVTVVAEKTEEIAKEVEKEAELIEDKSVELLESKEKREEFVEEVIDYVHEKLTDESAGKEKVEEAETDKAVGSDELAKLVEERADEVPKLSEEKADDIALPPRKEGLIDKLINLFKDEGGEGHPEGDKEPLIEVKDAAASEGLDKPVEELEQVPVEVKEEKPTADQDIADADAQKIASDERPVETESQKVIEEQGIIEIGDQKKTVDEEELIEDGKQKTSAEEEKPSEEMEITSTVPLEEVKSEESEKPLPEDLKENDVQKPLEKKEGLFDMLASMFSADKKGEISVCEPESSVGETKEPTSEVIEEKQTEESKPVGGGEKGPPSEVSQDTSVEVFQVEETIQTTEVVVQPAEGTEQREGVEDNLIILSDELKNDLPVTATPEENEKLVAEKSLELHVAEEKSELLPVETASELLPDKEVSEVPPIEASVVSELPTVEKVLEISPVEEIKESVTEDSTTVGHDDRRGLFGKIIDLFSKDEKKSESLLVEPVSQKKEDTSVEEAVCEKKEDTSVEEAVCEKKEDTPLEETISEKKEDSSVDVTISEKKEDTSVEETISEKKEDTSPEDSVAEMKEPPLEPKVEDHIQTLEPEIKVEELPPEAEIKAEESVLQLEVKEQVSGSEMKEVEVPGGELVEPPVEVKDAPSTKEKVGLVNILANLFSGDKTPEAEGKEAVVTSSEAKEPVAEVKDPVAEIKEPVSESDGEVKDVATEELKVEDQVQILEPEIKVEELAPETEIKAEESVLQLEVKEQVSDSEVKEVEVQGTEVIEPPVEVKDAPPTKEKVGLVNILANLFSGDKMPETEGKEPFAETKEPVAESDGKVKDIATEELKEPATEPQSEVAGQGAEPVAEVKEACESKTESKEDDVGPSSDVKEVEAVAEMEVKEVAAPEEVVVELSPEIKDTPVVEEKVGLIDRLANLFSGDKVSESKLPEEPISEPEAEVKELVSEPEVDVKETVAESDVRVEGSNVETITVEGMVTEATKETGTSDTQEALPDPKSSEIVASPAQSEGLFDKLVNIFSKDEKQKDSPISSDETSVDKEVVQVPADDKLADDASDFVIVEHADVKEDKDSVTEHTVLIEDKAATESNASESPKKSEGLFGKLMSFVSSDDKAEITASAEPMPPAEEKSDLPVPEVEQKVDDQKEAISEDKASEVVINTSTQEEATASSPEVGGGGLFAMLGSIFTPKDDVVEKPEPDLLEKPEEKDVTEDTSQPELVTAADMPTAAETTPEAPILEVKDKSLFDKLAEMVSSSDKKSDHVTAAESSDESTTLAEHFDDMSSQKEIPQQVPKSDESHEPSEDTSKPSIFGRVASIFSKDDDSVPMKEESGVVSEGTDESTSSPDSKAATNEDPDVFVVVSKPSTPVETPTPDEGRQVAEQATGWLQGSWFRNSGSVSQEGKDVVIQVAPKTPEKDYGQSHPEDSDMYTTRS